MKKQDLINKLDEANTKLESLREIIQEASLALSDAMDRGKDIENILAELPGEPEDIEDGE
jgi:hypothetical protein